MADGSALQAVRREVDRMTAAGQYMGHQLLGTNFRSFDLQSPTLAVVTASEAWQDTLYALQEWSPEMGDTVLADRGPYTLEATYRLDQVDEGRGPVWVVSDVAYAREPPAFE